MKRIGLWIEIGGRSIDNPILFDWAYGVISINDARLSFLNTDANGTID